jgi:hypothetical protein
MTKRRTALDRAVDQLSAKIDALVLAREALIEQRQPVPTPVAKPTPRRPRTASAPRPIEDAS